MTFLGRARERQGYSPSVGALDGEERRKRHKLGFASSLQKLAQFQSPSDLGLFLFPPFAVEVFADFAELFA